MAELVFFELFFSISLVDFPQVCNGNEYLKVTPAEMTRAWHKKQQLLSAVKDVQGQREVAEGHSEQSVAQLDSNSPGGTTTAAEDSGGIDMARVTISSTGVPLQVETVPEKRLATVELFFCCTTCGKVFWEGSHFVRVCEQFSHVLSDLEDKNSATVFTS